MNKIQRQIKTIQISIFNILFFVLFLNNLLYAQNKQLRVQYYTTENGLSQNFIECIFQDSRGFMWFGTWDGLNRSDGYKFVIYKPDKNKNSISNNFIQCISEDKEGNLWIGTRDGLNKYIFNEEKFIVFRQDSSDKKSIVDNWINTICFDTDGNLWIGTHFGGLDKIDAKVIGSSHPVFNHYFSDKNNSKTISDNNVQAIFEDHQKNLWIGTINGLNKLDRKTNSIIRFNPSLLTNPQIYSLHEDQFQLLWIGTVFGLNSYDYKTGTFIKHYPHPELQDSLTNGTIFSIIEDENKNLLIGTFASLNQYNREKNSFSSFAVKPNDNYSLNNGFINSLYSDKTGIVWVGTEKGGINKYNVFQKQFLTISQDIQNPNSLNNNIVNSICEDDKALWIGTAGGGLNKYDKKSKDFSYLLQETRNSIPDIKFVSALHLDNNKRLWAGTWGGGLRLLLSEKNGGIFKAYQHSDNSNSIISDQISGIFENRHDFLWITTWLGLDLFDPKAEKFYHVKGTSSNSPKIGSIGCLMEDRNNNLWIGGIDGLYRINLKNYNTLDMLSNPDTIFFYQYNPKCSNGLNGNYIIAMIEDNDGNLWFSSLGNGLNKLEKLSPDGTVAEFSHFTQNDGLSNNVVYGMLEDKKGNLWLSTDKGLSKFNYKNKTFRNYYQEDGLQGNQFYWSSCFQNDKGRMYFGGVNGLTYFYPDSIIDNPYTPRPVITDFKIFNKTVPVDPSGKGVLSKTITETNEIRLHFKQNVLSFEFAAINYASPEKNLYAYKMEGFDNDWTYTDASRRYVTYTNLNPGKYIFQLKASNNDGIWNKEVASVRIIILPSWWGTWWFKLICGVCILVFLCFLLYRIIRKIKRLANQTILNERNQLKTLINNLPDYVFIKDNKSRFVAINDSTIRYMGGKNEKEFINKSDFNFYTKEIASKYFSQEQEIIKTGVPLINEESNRHTNGTEKFYSTTKCPIINHKGEIIGLIGVVRDITTQKMTQLEIEKNNEEVKKYNNILSETNVLLEERQQQIEEQAEELRSHSENLKSTNDLLLEKQNTILFQSEQLKETNQKLSILNATKDKFFAIIAHDLRNPFNVVSGFSDILLRNFEKLTPEKIRKFHEMIYMASNSGNNLLENLLQWSRTQTGHISYVPSKFNLFMLVAETIKLMKGDAERKNIYIQQLIDPDINVFVDENMIKTILRNLISNAIKFTNEKGTIKFMSRIVNEQAEVIVSDNGVGIPEEDIKRLFRIDITHSTRGTANESGTGLGLLLCKEFVQKHGGRIWVESQVEKGSEFKFTIPVA